MTEQTDGQQPAAEAEAIAAPAQVETTAEATNAQQTDAIADTDGNDGGDDTANPEAPAKPAKGVQKRLDELTRQRHEAKREADHWREMAMRLNPPAEATPAQPRPFPTPEQFNYDDAAYQQAVTQYAAEQVRDAVKSTLEQERAADREAKAQQSIQQKLAEAAAKHPDYDEIAERIPLTEAVRSALAEDADAIDVLMEIGRNEDRAALFARMSPYQQAVEMGRVKATLTKPAAANLRNPPPPPPKTVAGIAAGVQKDPGAMSMTEYVAWRKANP